MMLSVSGKNWEEEIINQRLVDKIKIENNLTDIISRHIISNKFDSEEIYSINNFLKIINPFSQNSDFLNAIELLNQAIYKKENICIIGDYDVDGCVSTSLLIKLIKHLKGSYFYYIPNRFKDGYGSSTALLKKLIHKKPKLVILLDNGSSSNEAVDYLNKKKIKSIIIDHHEIYKPFPKSNVLINTKKNNSYAEFNYFCTGVLTYFFIDLFIKKKKCQINFSKYLYLVLLTVVSDVMPLRKINRKIANTVLNNINLNNIYFFKKIYEIKKIKKKIDIEDFGFLFGPIINSAGRIGDPNIIVELLTSDDIIFIDKTIKNLVNLNEKRKDLEKEILKNIDLENIRLENKSIIILENKNINEGLIGIIASRIKNYFNKPTIVITKSSNIYKGSARSTKGFAIGKYIKSALDSKLLVSGGGHNLAAGFTLKEKNLEKFKTYLYNKHKDNHKDFSFKFLSKISLNALNKDFLSELKKVGPYGEENLNPYFLIENIKIIKTKIKKNKLLSFYVKNKTGKIIEVITFDLINTDLIKNILFNKREVNIIVQLNENIWNNKKRLQIIVVDLIDASNKA